ncbi:MAG: MmgE/PrpD family protein [Desulfobacteraceae bacterium]|nr:MAG: MmgE/PrpD family protein [Desulfobacteraceae bacterium]
MKLGGLETIKYEFVRRKAVVKVDNVERTYSRKLGEFVERLAFDDVPKKVIEEAKLHILDTLGVALAAYGMDFAQIMLEVSKGLGGPPESTVIGSGERLSAPNAALVNGTMAHGLDYDDMHREAALHLSAFAVPTALAVSEAQGKSGKSAIVGVVAGYEVGARLGLAASGRLLLRGWHPTGVLGAFAAAAVTGSILALSAKQISTAMGIAGSQSSGLAQWIEEGSWTKRMHPGWAAHSGIIAVLLAQKGYDGPQRIYEGKMGLYNSYLGEGNFDLERLTQGLGSRWETRQICYKLYPCGY